MDDALKNAIRQGGGTKAVALKLGISHQAIVQWERCPPLRVLQLESASGVPRHELRPDIYPAPAREKVSG